MCACAAVAEAESSDGPRRGQGVFVEQRTRMLKNNNTFEDFAHSMDFQGSLPKSSLRELFQHRPQRRCLGHLYEQV